MTTVESLTYEQALGREKAIQAELERLKSKPHTTAEDRTAVPRLLGEFRQVHAHRLDLEHDAALGEIRSAAYGTGEAAVVDGHRGQLHRDNALRALDAHVNTGRLAARGAELVEGLMTSGPVAQQSWTRRYATVAASEDYERAFRKLVADPERGHLTWTQPEADAYRAAAALQSEQRAMSTTDSAGGYLIPLTLDPAVQITSNGSVNPLRQIARVVQTTGDAWNGITSAGVTAEWLAEADEAADASPTIGQPVIPVHKASSFVPFSFEVEGDALGFMTELGRLLVDAAEQLSAAAFTTGSGTGQPKGIITSLVGSAGTVPLVAPGIAETLAASDVYAVQNALPPRFQAGAQWCANLAVINTLRQFETGSGALKFPGLQGTPPVLLGRTMNELSNMDGTINAAATESNYPLLYGDFQNFTIVDRIGSTIELVPHLVGANRRPTGQRGALLWFRTGSDVVVPQAFRLLSIPTTA